MVAVEFRADELEQCLLVVLDLAMFPAGQSAGVPPRLRCPSLVRDDDFYWQQLGRRRRCACWGTLLTLSFHSIPYLQQLVALR